MEKTADAEERVESTNELAVKSVEKDVLVSDIIPQVAGTEDEQDIIVMVGAEILQAQQSEQLKEARTGSGLVSIPTIIEKELQDLLPLDIAQEKLVGSNGTVKEDGDGKEVVEEKGKDGEETKEKKDRDNGEKDKKDKKDKKKDDGDGDKKEKKEKKDKGLESGEAEKDKDKKDKKDKKKEKKNKKSTVERIQKKLEKIHGKIERIMAKKEEYIQRLAEAQEKELQEKEEKGRLEKGRLSAEKAENDKRDLAATETKPSEDSVLADFTGQDGQSAEVKQIDPSVPSSTKEVDAERPAPHPSTPENEDGIPVSATCSEEKVASDEHEKVEDAKDSSNSEDVEVTALSIEA